MYFPSPDRITRTFPWKRVSVVFWGLTVLLSLVILATVSFSIFGGAGYNDEAWLVLMVQNKATGFWTSFAYYYSLIRQWGLAEMRAAVAIVHGLSCAVFVYGAVSHYRPFRSHARLSSVGLWCVCALLPQVFWLGGVVLAPDYKFVAYDCALIGLGFFFLGLDHGLWLVLSGICFVQILFTLPQVAILAPLFLFIACMKDIRKAVPFIVGGVLGILIFFLVISSWQDFQGCFAYSGTRIAHATQGRHGFGMLVTGYCKILLLFCCNLVPTALALYLAHANKHGKGFLFLALVLMLVGFALGTLRVLSWKSAGCPACSLDVFLILSCYVVISIVANGGWSREHLLDSLLAMLFVLVPVAFCTGTDKGFENRLTFYIGVLFTGIVIFAYRQKDRLALATLTFFLVLASCAGLLFWKQTSNFNLLPHTVNAAEEGFPADAPISLQMASHLKEIKPYTDGVKIVANDPNHWYVPYLLKKEMLHLTSFRYYQFDDVAAMIEQRQLRPDEIILLESPEYALGEEQLLRIQQVLQSSSMERIVLVEAHHIIRFH